METETKMVEAKGFSIRVVYQVHQHPGVSRHVIEISNIQACHEIGDIVQAVFKTINTNFVMYNNEERLSCYSKTLADCGISDGATVDVREYWGIPVPHYASISEMKSLMSVFVKITRETGKEHQIRVWLHDHCSVSDIVKHVSKYTKRSFGLTFQGSRVSKSLSEHGIGDKSILYVIFNP